MTPSEIRQAIAEIIAEDEALGLTSDPEIEREMILDELRELEKQGRSEGSHNSFLIHRLCQIEAP